MSATTTPRGICIGYIILFAKKLENNNKLEPAIMLAKNNTLQSPPSIILVNNIIGI